MPIKVTCGKCANVLNAPDSAGGKKGKCPKCATVMDIPTGPIVPAGPVPPPPPPQFPTPSPAGNPFAFAGGAAPAPAPANAPPPPPAENPFSFNFGAPASATAPAPAATAPPPPKTAPKPTAPAPAAKAPAAPPKPAPKSAPVPANDNPFSFGDEPVPIPAAVKTATPPKAAPGISKPTPPPTPAPVGDNPFSFGFDQPSEPAPAPAAPSPKPAAKPAPAPAAKKPAPPPPKPAAKPAPAPAAENPFAFVYDDPTPPAPEPEKPAKPAAKPAGKLTAPKTASTPAAPDDDPFGFLNTVVSDPSLQPSGDAVRIGEEPPPEPKPAAKVEAKKPAAKAEPAPVSDVIDVDVEPESGSDLTPAARVATAAPNANPFSFDGSAPTPANAAPRAAAPALVSGSPFDFGDDAVSLPPPVAGAPVVNPGGDSFVEAELVEDSAPALARRVTTAEGNVRIRIGANTESPALLSLRVKGYRVWLEYAQVDDPTNKWYPFRPDYHAEAGDSRFTANTAVELLGLVAMWETRGDNWSVRPGEPNVFDELKSKAKRVDAKGNKLP